MSTALRNYAMKTRTKGLDRVLFFLQTPFLHRMKCHDSLSSPRGRKEGEETAEHPQNSQHHESSVWVTFEWLRQWEPWVWFNGNKEQWLAWHWLVLHSHRTGVHQRLYIQIRRSNDSFKKKTNKHNKRIFKGPMCNIYWDLLAENGIGNTYEHEFRHGKRNYACFRNESSKLWF